MIQHSQDDEYVPPVSMLAIRLETAGMAVDHFPARIAIDLNTVPMVSVLTLSEDNTLEVAVSNGRALYRMVGESPILCQGSPRRFMSIMDLEQVQYYDPQEMEPVEQEAAPSPSLDTVEGIQAAMQVLGQRLAAIQATQTPPQTFLEAQNPAPARRTMARTRPAPRSVTGL